MRITALTMPEPGLQPLLDAIADADRAGFSRAWLPQMPALPGVAPWDALMVLALAGRQNPGIELATAVSIAYHQHPLTLARQALTASAAVSVDGAARLTLGLGVSHPSMIEALGYSYDRPARYLREYLEILLPALAGEPVDFHGAQVSAVGQVDLPGAPRPPVVLAALGPRMLDLAGSLTDGTVTTWAGPRTLEQHIVPRISRAAASAGRPAPQVVAGLPVVVTSDPDAARTALTATFSIANTVPAYRAVLDAEGAAGIGDVCIIGDEELVESRLRHFAEIGVTEFAAMPFGDHETVTRTLELLAALRA